MRNDKTWKTRTSSRFIYKSLILFSVPGLKHSVIIFLNLMRVYLLEHHILITNDLWRHLSPSHLVVESLKFRLLLCSRLIRNGWESTLIQQWKPINQWALEEGFQPIKEIILRCTSTAFSFLLLSLKHSDSMMLCQFQHICECIYTLLILLTKAVPFQ